MLCRSQQILVIAQTTGTRSRQTKLLGDGEDNIQTQALFGGFRIDLKASSMPTASWLLVRWVFAVGLVFLNVFACAGSLASGCQFSSHSLKTSVISKANDFLFGVGSSMVFFFRGVRVGAEMSRLFFWGLRARGGRLATVWLLPRTISENGARGRGWG